MKIPIIVGIVAFLIVIGVGLVASDFTAYLGNNPAACNNCHVMDYVYEGWYHSGHQEWAACGDCHTPHSFIRKYAIKAYSGYRHVTAFVFGHIPEAIRAKTYTRKIVQENCIRCHEATISSTNEGMSDSDRTCFDCHRNVAHGERGISILPYRNLEVNQ